jgi:hypothetical protein
MWVKRSIKWKNSCLSCGCSLNVGDSGWMDKDEITGKWRFCCDKCFDARANSPKAKVVKTLLESAMMAPSFADDITFDTGMLSDILSMVSSAAEMPVVEKKKSPLENIAANAKWRLIQ